MSPQFPWPNISAEMQFEIEKPMVSCDSRTTQPAKTTDVAGWPEPFGTPAQCRKQPCSLQGPANFYRRLVPHFANLPDDQDSDLFLYQPARLSSG